MRSEISKEYMEVVFVMVILICSIFGIAFIIKNTIRHNKETESLKRGDLNLDGKVDVMDFSKMMVNYEK